MSGRPDLLLLSGLLLTILGLSNVSGAADRRLGTAVAAAHATAPASSVDRPARSAALKPPIRPTAKRAS